MAFHELVGLAAQALEALGVAVIAGGSLLAGLITIIQGLQAGDLGSRYRLLRQRVGQSLLLGLEILVGGDVIRTVADQPTMQGVTVLAVVVVIRTFLSFTLEVELEGRWPWQREVAP